MQSMEEIYRQHAQTVYRYLLAQTRSADLAEELTQETFYQAMRHWRDFRGQSALPTWLCTIAKRLYFDYCRKPPPQPTQRIETGESVQDAAEQLIASDRRVAVFRLLHDLPEPYREVFTLRTFGELTHAEIAALFGKSESWARVTYYRGRQLLRRMAEEEKHET